jgi:ABC-type multidrug transport system, ATPase and permease components
MRSGSTVGHTPAGWRPALAEAALLVHGERRLLVAVVALIVVNRVAALWPALASKIVIDRIVGGHRPDLLPPLTLALLAAVAIEAGSRYSLYRAIGICSQRAVTRLRMTLQAHVLRLPTGFFDDNRTGALLARLMTDPDTVRDVFGPGLVQAASGALTAVLAFAVLISLDWRLSSALLAMLFAALAALICGLSWLHQEFRATSERAETLTGRLAEVLSGIRVVKGFRGERREALSFARESHRILRASARASTAVAATLALSALASGLMGAVVLFLGGRRVLDGRLTMGDLVLYLFLVGLLATPLLQIAAHVSELGRASAALGRIAELKAIEIEDRRANGLGGMSAITGAVAFERVGYAYLPGRWALHDVSFEVASGATVAIVGLNGAGKTTALMLLAGLARPTTGRIVVDGRDLAEVRLGDWRKHTAAVLQEPFLFEGTIADNIAYGRPGASANEIRRVGRLAHCEEFVVRLSDGYASRVGERGIHLSGGQRQLVTIARALLADPRILLLDEPTAPLDLESETLIRDALLRLRTGRTTFVIAHRFATVLDADQILVFDRGVLIERGTHDELVARGGAYWRLANRGPVSQVLGEDVA